MADQLEQFFSEGVLVRPSDRQPNLVHLVRAIGRLCGVQDVELDEPARHVADLIGPAEHLVFVLLDGLGMNVVRRLPADSFLRSSLRQEILATCPSTTACALTSVASGQYANRHGICGWFTYLPEFGVTAVVLPFAERFTNEPLARRGIQPQDVLTAHPLCGRMTRDALTIVPASLANTMYNKYTRDGTAGAGYDSIHHAVDQIAARVRQAGAPSYTHLYLPEIDTICHKLSVESEVVLPLVMQIDRELARLASAVAGKARLVLSADHGLIDVPREAQTLLYHDDPLLDCLVVPPTGDARMPIFHVCGERGGEFVEVFTARFGDRMLLLPIADAERHELFGPGPIAPAVRPHFGDFVAIPFAPATLAYHPPGKPAGALFQAVHAGLSPDEMQVPLCVA